ncbi:hypothetical protein SOVF_139840 [Spinacia oleracea]|nr:hypothetical protein SOVF_139840 [Spinacia oleracea]
MRRVREGERLGVATRGGQGGDGDMKLEVGGRKADGEGRRREGVEVAAVDGGGKVGNPSQVHDNLGTGSTVKHNYGIANWTVKE